MLDTDHVQTTVLRRAAGAGKRALTEYPKARLALSLSIVGGGGSGDGGDTAKGDAVRLRSLFNSDSKSSRARDKLVRYCF